MSNSIRAFIFSEERILSGPSNLVVWFGESYHEVRYFSQMVSESDFLQASYIRRVSTIQTIHFLSLSSPFPRFVYPRTLLSQKKILRRWNHLFGFCPWYVPDSPPILWFDGQFAARVIGAVLHPIMLNKLINGPVGFHKAVKISAALNVFLLVIAGCLMRTRLPPKEIQHFPIIQWLKEPAYLAFILRSVAALNSLHQRSTPHLQHLVGLSVL